ncbi:MAG: Ku protein [Deltaproteobacteria bacterium]
MAMQSIWSGTISFSLVAIPVQLVKAVEPGRVSFRLLHNKDYSPLSRKMFCPREEKIVDPDQIIRGYEIGPDKYITVTDEELESVSPERSRTIEISEFVDLADIDSIYYDHPYYLVPAKGGEKAYQLLAEVMRRTNKAGLAKFVLGEREYSVAVKNTDGALSLITLHYSEEILPDDPARPGTGETEAAEVARMKKIIKEMTVNFNPDKHVNERRKSVLALLKKKAKKQPPVTPPEVEESDEGPADLVSLLAASMRKVKKSH